MPAPGEAPVPRKEEREWASCSISLEEVGAPTAGLAHETPGIDSILIPAMGRRYAKERFYPISPDEAWRLLADTDHLNRTIGLPSVDFAAPRDFVRRARARYFGIPATWEEFPFEWVRERRYAVKRAFLSGPVLQLVGGAELEPRPGGVVVRIFAGLPPRNALARPLMGLIARRGITRTLAYCDRYLSQRADPLAPPRPASMAGGVVDRRALHRALAALTAAPVDLALVDRLQAPVLRGSDRSE